MKIDKKYLIDFEKEVIKEFKKGETYGPVHLSGGNEDALIKIFKDIKANDWVFSTHRSHYHALLKSQDRKWLIGEIIKNANSSHINSAKHKIFTSAIVGGIIPIALGTAMGIKMKSEKMNKELKEEVELIEGIGWKIIKGVKVTTMNQSHVWCFIGDMAAEMGCFVEAVKYAEGEDLPITFVIENNELGCNTPTAKVWKEHWFLENVSNKIITYKYIRHYPHYGIGEWVTMSNEKIRTKGDYVAEDIK